MLAMHFYCFFKEREKNPSFGDNCCESHYSCECVLCQQRRKPGENLNSERPSLVLCCLQRLCITTYLVLPMAGKNGAQEGGIGCDVHIYI